MRSKLAIGIAALALCLALVGCGGRGRRRNRPVTRTGHDELAENSRVMPNCANRGESAIGAGAWRGSIPNSDGKDHFVRLEGRAGWSTSEATGGGRREPPAQLNIANAEVTRADRRDRCGRRSTLALCDGASLMRKTEV